MARVATAKVATARVVVATAEVGRVRTCVHAQSACIWRPLEPVTRATSSVLRGTRLLRREWLRRALKLALYGVAPCGASIWVSSVNKAMPRSLCAPCTTGTRFGGTP